jgi:hypothetical protein
MHPSVLQFTCGHCQAQLTVPVQMAGVSGPCPKCGQTVTSPSLPPQAVPTWAPHPIQAPVAPVAPASMPPSLQAPLPQWSQQPPAVPQRPATRPLQPMSGVSSVLNFPNDLVVPPVPPAPAPHPVAGVWSPPPAQMAHPAQAAPVSQVAPLTPAAPPLPPMPPVAREGGQTLLAGLLGNQDRQFHPTTQPLSAKSSLPPAREPGMAPAGIAGGFLPPQQPAAPVAPAPQPSSGPVSPACASPSHR